MGLKEIAAMLENHCNVGIMLIKLQGEVDDWKTKAYAWGYVMGLILDGYNIMNRAHYADDEQYLAFDTALMRAMMTGKMLRGILEDK